jgi:serine phosphatase RsbU (regulator of sigma subunit)
MPGGAAMTVAPERRTAPGLAEELTAVLTEVAAAMGADSASVLVPDTTRTALETLTSVGLDRTPRLAARVPLGQGFAGRVALTRSPVRLDEITSDNVLNPVLRAHGIRSVAGVPLIEEDELVGVLHVGSRIARRFAAADESRLLEIGKQVASIVHARSRLAEHSAAEALQKSLLPAEPPVLPGLEAAVRYLPAEGDLGGDWYDVFELPGRRVGVVMGDVVGHGLNAAVMMGRLKSALRAYALEHEDPATVLSLLDRKVTHFEPDTLATVIFAVAEPPYREFLISSAGHWSPMLVTGDRPAHAVALDPGLLLGVDHARPRSSTRVALPPGAVMCFFTDGLIERRSDVSQAGELESRLDRLGAVLDPARSAEQNCRNVIAALVAQDVIEDDVAILVLRALD